jgi:putative ABC transport system permease protein
MIEKKKRIFLTISGIIIGIFTFTFFIFLSQGLSNAITEQFSSFGLNVLVVRPYDAGNGGPPTGSGLDDTHISKIKQVIRGYKYVAPAIFTSQLYEAGREKAVVTSLAYPDEYWKDVFEDLGAEIQEGRFLRQGDRNVVLLGAKTAREAFNNKQITVGSSLKIGDRSFRVIGILKERGDLFVDNALLMPFKDIKEVSNQETYSVIRISFYQDVDLETQQEAILRKLNPNNKEKVVSISSPQQAIDQFNSILGVLTMIIGFVSGIALLVGGINVMNTMYSSVLERINEISVFKAIGSTNGNILKLFLVESGILGFLGGLIGFLGAFSLAKYLSYIIITIAKYNVPVYWDTSFFIEVLLVTTIAAMIFGTYPAARAAKINPSDNLRDE